MPCRECNMAKSSLFFVLERKKNLSPNFGVIVFFGLGRFSIYRVVGLLKSSFWQEALKRWSPCSLTDSQIHGLIKTGRFFENPLVGRHVLWFIIKDMAFGCDVRWFMIESPVGQLCRTIKNRYHGSGWLRPIRSGAMLTTSKSDHG